MSLFSSLFSSTTRTTEIDNPLDAVDSIASLASTPAAIDPILDEVRKITSKLKPGESPTQSEETTLLSVYLKLESYLINDDPVRSFSKSELRNRLNKNLQEQINSLSS